MLRGGEQEGRRDRQENRPSHPGVQSLCWNPAPVPGPLVTLVSDLEQVTLPVCSGLSSVQWDESKGSNFLGLSRIK